MSSYRVQAAPSHGTVHSYLLLALLLSAALTAVGAPSFARTDVIADGMPYSLRAGATVGDLVTAGRVEPTGDILATDGSVVTTGGGEPPTILRNGRPLSSATLLRDGDVIVTRAGENRIESLVTITVSIPIPIRYEGSGPLATLVSPGAVGVEERLVGEFSGLVSTSTVVQAASPMVVKRFSPPTSNKWVALTFDDGPWPVQTEQILNILAAEEVKATFFVVGKQAYKYPLVMRRIVSEGHVVGNHTQGHLTLDRVGRATVRQQIADGQTAVQKTTQKHPRWFRPPGGHLSSAVGAEMQRYGLSLVMWSVDPQDWREPSAGVLAAELLRTIKPGSIVLLHDGGGTRAGTVAALPSVICELKRQGYTFVTLDEMTAKK
ncbi:MAG: polysaccharide deacetylase family protein [Coriobacteriia bacterium]